MSKPIAYVVYKDIDGSWETKPIYVDMEIQMIRIGEDKDIGNSFGYLITGTDLEIECI
jgi:hypothetical protein